MSDFKWSFSQWETYDTCPQRWKFQSVLKLPRSKPGPAAARGLEIHASIEDFICQRLGSTLHKDISPKYVPIFQEYRDHPNGDRHVEYKLGLTTQWTVSTGFSPTTWCSMVLDAVRVLGPVAYVGEWKSGSPKDRHADQRKLYALGALIRWPWVEEAHVTTYYVEDKAPAQRIKVTQNAVGKLKDLWLRRADQMQNDQFCAPKPGIHCNWCDYAKKKGGPCQFGS